MRSRALVPVVLTLLVSSGCTSQSRPVAVAPVAAQLSVERFLQAANERDVDSMGRLFGTADGSLMNTGSTFSCFFKKIGSWFGGSACTRRTDVELRMDAIASIISSRRISAPCACSCVADMAAVTPLSYSSRRLVLLLKLIDSLMAMR